jgi:hypothetical protein
MDAALMQLQRNAGQLILILNGHVRRAVVSVMPQGLSRAAVAPDTGPAAC